MSQSVCFAKVCAALFTARLSKLRDQTLRIRGTVYFDCCRTPNLYRPGSFYCLQTRSVQIFVLRRLNEKEKTRVNNVDPAECGGKASLLEFPSSTRAQPCNLSTTQLDLQRASQLCVCVCVSVDARG